MKKTIPNLVEAINLKIHYHKMPLNEFVKELEEHLGIKIPKEAVERYRFIGLNNTDMITCDFLEDYGIKLPFKFKY